MWELDYKESWAPKNWSFWTVVLEKTLESPVRSNQLILKEIGPEYSLEGLMLKLNPHYFGHLMWRTDSSEKTLMLGKIEGRRRRGQQRMSWLDGITDSMDMNLLLSMDSKEFHRTEQLNWTELPFQRFFSKSLWNVGSKMNDYIPQAQCYGNKIRYDSNWANIFVSLDTLGLQLKTNKQTNK